MTSYHNSWITDSLDVLSPAVSHIKTAFKLLFRLPYYCFMNWTYAHLSLSHRTDSLCDTLLTPAWGHLGVQMWGRKEKVSNIKKAFMYQKCLISECRWCFFVAQVMSFHGYSEKKSSIQIVLVNKSRTLFV